MLNFIAWAPYTQEIRSYFAPNGKFATSLNKVFVSKYLLVIFLLLSIHSFQVASDFPVNPTNYICIFTVKSDMRACFHMCEKIQ